MQLIGWTFIGVIGVLGAIAFLIVFVFAPLVVEVFCLDGSGCKKRKQRRGSGQLCHGLRASYAYAILGIAIAVLFAMLVASIEGILPKYAIPVVVVAIGVLGILITLEPFGRITKKIRSMRRSSVHATDAHGASG